MTLIDLSHPICNSMPVYPGDTATKLVQTAFLEIDGYNTFRLDTGMHAGTHIDSPLHMSGYAQYISEAPLDNFIAQGVLIDVRNKPVIELESVYENLIQPNTIVLFYTGWDKLFGTRDYFVNHPVINPDLCKLIVDRGVKLLGVDLPSPDKPPFYIHKMLFDNNIFILENLTNLEKLLGVPQFEVMAFPLKVCADSSLVRVVARIYND